MNSSRKEGILVIQTKKPYKMAKGSLGYADATEIICHEFTSKVNRLAFDLEQMFRIAMDDTRMRRAQNKKAETEAVDNADLDAELAKMRAFEENESPTESDIEDNAIILENMFSINKAVMTSELMDVWEGVIDAGLICIEGDQKMPKTIWESIDRDDQRRIMFGYISFFVKPVYRLERLFVEREKKSGSQATSERSTQ